VAPNSRRDQWGNFRMCVEFSAFRGAVRPFVQQPVAEYALPGAGIWPALFAVDVKSDCHAAALAYHVAFFTRINPAAWLFAALFLGQAVLFFRVGVVQRRLSFAPWGNAWAPLAWGLIGYSLADPAINAIDHLSLLRIPTFGLPCPTTIFTAGVLMLATPRSWRLSTVPVIWSAIGGSATFLLGVNADVALPMAGMALAIFSVRRTTPEPLRAGRVVPG
jgi:Family of unknown function (DUF6064)